MKIALLGDISFFGKFDESNPSIKEYFKEVSEYLSAFDIVIGNLETPFAINNNHCGSKSAYIKSNPNNVNLLHLLNIDVVNLANNHIYDYGIEGYRLTKKILDENGIKYLGIENKECVIERDNNKVALHGYCCYSSSPIGILSEEGIGINPLNVPMLERNLEKYKDGYFNIASIHAGEEHVNIPNINHIKLARQLAHKYDFLYYGHHPHVLQGIETVNNSLIAYSLGNFCFDDVYTSKSKMPLVKMSENNKQSVILEIELEDNKVISYKTTGIYLGENQMIVNAPEIPKFLSEYSGLLKSDLSELKAKRAVILTKYYDSRKQQRNFLWYWKRLNINSVKMIFNSRNNAKSLYKNLIMFLK